MSAMRIEVKLDADSVGVFGNVMEAKQCAGDNRDCLFEVVIDGKCLIWGHGAFSQIRSDKHLRRWFSVHYELP